MHLHDTLFLYGSVKLWAGLSRELSGSDCTKDTVPFVLLREVGSIVTYFSPLKCFEGSTQDEILITGMLEVLRF